MEFLELISVLLVAVDAVVVVAIAGIAPVVLVVVILLRFGGLPLFRLRGISGANGAAIGVTTEVKAASERGSFNVGELTVAIVNKEGLILTRALEDDEGILEVLSVMTFAFADEGGVDRGVVVAGEVAVGVPGTEMAGGVMVTAFVGGGVVFW